MIRSMLFLLSGNASSSALLFARNLLVARLVSVEDYGIAATFALSMSVVEMMSNIGLQQLIVQNRRGDDPEFQASLQGFHLVRGVFAGLALFLLAHPIADLLQVSEIAWSYQILAIVPVIRGFEHFDVHRLNRHHNFVPLMSYKFFPAVVGLASVWPLYHFVGGYEVMLYSIILQWVTSVAVSQIMAVQKYWLSFDTAIFRQALIFGWPLLINGMFMFGAMQGDRVIVGSNLGMEQLAYFSMGLTLTMTPSAILAGSMSQILLPKLSAVSDDPEKFQRLSMKAIQSSILAGLTLVAGVMLLGPLLIEVLLGEKYKAVIPLLTLFAVAQAIAIFKVGGTIAALARAQTSNAMIANTVRVIALIPAFYFALREANLQTIIVIGLIGELAAFLVSIFLLKVRLNISLTELTWPVAACSVFLIAALFYEEFASGARKWELATITTMIAAYAATLYLSRALRIKLRSLSAKK